MNYGRWTIICETPIQNSAYQKYFWCRCVCGTERIVSLDSLKRRKSKSCGCLRDELASQKSRKHGLTGTKVYKTWQKMKERCYSKSCKDYPDYGGRGITVYGPWRKSFLAFLKDVGPPPIGKSIDRIDNNGSYVPGNIQFSDGFQQANNKRNNRPITAFGRTMNLSQWAREKGLLVTTIYSRLKRGWSAEKALSTTIFH